MKTLILSLALLLACAGLSMNSVHAQDDAEKIQAEIDQAFVYYKKEQYEKALPIFKKYSKILIEYRKNSPEQIQDLAKIIIECLKKTGDKNLSEYLLELIEETNNDPEKITYAIYDILSPLPPPFIQPSEIVEVPDDDFEDTELSEYIDWLTLIDRAKSFYESKNYVRTIEELEKAKIQAEKEFGKNHENYANTCNNLAFLYHSQGLYAKAEPLYLDAWQIRAKVLGKEHPDYISSCNNFAVLYIEQGLYSKAAPLYLEILQIRAKVLGKEHPDYAASCNNLALLYQSQGLYSKAELLYLESKQIKEKVLGKEHPDYAASCNNLALLYDFQGLYSKAEPLYIEAKEICGKILGKEHSYYTLSCNNLALLYQSQGLYSKAESLYLESKQIKEKVLGKEHPDYATSCNNLATLYQTQNLYAKAELLYLEAKQIIENIVGKEHPDYATSCNNLATLYQTHNLYSKAEPLYLEAKEICEKVWGKEHPDYATSCNNLAVLYQNQGLYSKAEPLYVESKTIIFKSLEKNNVGLSEKERKASWEKNFAYFSNFYLFALERCGLGTKSKNPKEISTKITDDWFDVQLASKGLLANGTQKMQKIIRNSNNVELKRIFEEWTSLRTSISKAYNLTEYERQEKGIDLQVLDNQANELEKQLSRLSADFAKLTEKTPTWTDLRKKLQPDEVAVELVKVNYAKDTVFYVALLVTPNTLEQPDIVVLRNGTDLEGKQIKLYRNNAIYKMDDKNSYDLFWKPIWEKIQSLSPAVKKIYYSPDGVYNQLNINTLQNPVSKKFVLEEIEIQQVTNLKDVMSFNSTETFQKFETFGKFSAFLIGRPSYQLEQAKYQQFVKQQTTEEDLFASRGSNIGDMSFTDLRGTEKEIRTIDSLFRANGLQTETHYFEQASEEKVKAVVSPLVVHIATHGFFLAADTTKKFDDPMLRSGIVLAGVSNYAQATEKPKTEDGVLTAQEAQSLSFDDTEVVVLSACETGLGEVSAGEGVYGLQRALKVAGAKTLLMSLWKVDDTATQILMSLFYANWLQKKQSKRLAFVNAQNALRAMPKYKHFNFWGAFVLIGE